MIGAGLLAKKAVEAGLSINPAVKTSLAPGSKVVTRYLENTGLLPFLEKLGFHLVGYGCTTCIGNSGPLPEHIRTAIHEADLVAASVLSGNRNFEGRIHPYSLANYLASPPLVVAYALAGTMDIDLPTSRSAPTANGQPVYLTRHLAHPGRDPSALWRSLDPRDVPRAVRQRVRRQRGLERHPRGRRRNLRLGRGQHLHPGAALLHRT